MRVALTGAASGIGADVAERLKEQGDEVVAFDLIEPKRHIDQWIKTDLGNPHAIQDAVNQAEGPFDALINNAGIPPLDGNQKQVLQVNFLGLRSLMNAMLHKLNRGASIVNTASRAGAFWRDNIDEVKALMSVQTDRDLDLLIERYDIKSTRAYNLSKEALIVQTLADTERFLDRGLRVNCVSPAAVSTGILDAFIDAFGDRATKAIARAGRPGETGEIADVIIFLASAKSAWIKGQDITIDGGMTAMATSDALDLYSSS